MAVEPVVFVRDTERRSVVVIRRRAQPEPGTARTIVALAFTR